MHEYTETVKDHFQNPRNIGEIADPDGYGEAVSPACGDMVRLAFRVDEAERIIDVKCKIAGCVSTIAAVSALTEMLQGLTVEEAGNIRDADIVAYLGGLPMTKGHAVAIGQEVLQKAILEFRSRNGR